MKNIDEALIVPFEDLRNNITRAESPIMCKIHPIRYAEAVYQSLCTIDPRFIMISDDFREKILFKALGMEILSKNKKTKRSTELIYPTYVNLLHGIFYFKKANPTIKLNAIEFDLVNNLFQEAVF